MAKWLKLYAINIYIFHLTWLVSRYAPYTPCLKKLRFFLSELCHISMNFNKFW